MGDRGWFRLHREGWLWGLSPNRFRLACQLLKEANWRSEPTRVPVRGEVIEVPRGACLVSRSGLAQRCGLSEKVVRVGLDWFETEGFLGRKRAGGRANGPTLVFIKNYSVWQGDEDGEGQLEGHSGAGEGPVKGRSGARSKKEERRKKDVVEVDETQGVLDLDPGSSPQPIASSETKKTKPKRKPGRQPADNFLDAFARGAGELFVRPAKLDGRTAPMLNKLWKQLREAGYTLADIEAAGRELTTWREKDVDLSWLTFGTNLVSAIARAKRRGVGRSRTEYDEKWGIR